MRGDVTQLVGRSLLGRHHPARAALLQLDLPAALHQRLTNAARGHFRGLGQRSLRAVAERFEALLADIFLELAKVRKNLGRVARNAQRRGNHQKGQDQQKPPGAVNSIQAGQAEHLRPERPELIHIIGERLLLLEHRADD